MSTSLSTVERNLLCATCGRAGLNDSLVCSGCGQEFLAPAASAHAEQRQVTALFCDLVDSVTLTLRLDPEELMQVFDLYLAACDDIVSAHGGRVMQYMGDGVLAYFGYKQAQDSDAANAVRAAIAIRDALGRLLLPAGINLRSRIGVATGLVMINERAGRGDGRGNGIVGETPHMAARLQTVAKPDMVVVADATRCLAEGPFTYRALGTFRLSGFPTPVTAFEAV